MELLNPAAITAKPASTSSIMQNRTNQSVPDAAVSFDYYYGQIATSPADNQFPQLFNLVSGGQGQAKPEFRPYSLG